MPCVEGFAVSSKTSTVEGFCTQLSGRLETAWGHAMLMRPNKAETAIHGCHRPGNVAVRMRKVLTKLQSRSQSPRSFDQRSESETYATIPLDKSNKGSGNWPNRGECTCATLPFIFTSVTSNNLLLLAIYSFIYLCGCLRIQHCYFYLQSEKHQLLGLRFVHSSDWRPIN